MGPNGTERGFSWAFVPFLGTKKTCFGSIQNTGPRQPKQYERETVCTCHDTTACWSAKIVITSNYLVVHLHQTRLCCARSVGPFSPRQKEAKDVFFFPLLQNCFSRAAWNLFDFGNQSVTTHLAKKYSIRFVPVLLGGG